MHLHTFALKVLKEPISRQSRSHRCFDKFDTSFFTWSSQVKNYLLLHVISTRAAKRRFLCLHHSQPGRRKCHLFQFSRRFSFSFLSYYLFPLRPTGATCPEPAPTPSPLKTPSHVSSAPKNTSTQNPHVHRHGNPPRQKSTVT